MLSFADSLFEFPLLRPSRFLLRCLCFGLRHRKPICKCEPDCLCKKSPHFINQQVITFQLFWDLISPHRKNALTCILLYFSKLKFHRMSRTFLFRLPRFLSFFAEIWQEFCLIMWERKPCRGIFHDFLSPSKIMSIYAKLMCDLLRLNV